MIQTKIDTSKVLLEKAQKQQKNIYYIPGYLRLKVKNFTQMNLDNLDAQMNATIIFTIYYGDLANILKNNNDVGKDASDIVGELQKSIILLFGRDDAIKLFSDQENLETKVKSQPKFHEISFTVRKLFHLRIESDVFWSPFQIINLILSITVQPVTTKWGTIKVNLMDYTNMFSKLSYTQQGTFGNYDLAESRMRTQYSNNRVCKVQNFNMKQQQKEAQYDRFWQKQKWKKALHFQYAHFNIPLYKFPVVALATIFLPLWLLAIINLGIFFQDENLADRIASIAALMIAFVALIPTIRDQIPPNPKIVFIEILVYLQTLTSLFALIHSIDVRNISKYDLAWQQSGLFLVSMIITILTVVIVLFMMFLHYFIWEPGYNRTVDQQDDQKFKRKDWKNKLCDKYFSTLMDKAKDIKLSEVPQPQPNKGDKKE